MSQVLPQEVDIGQWLAGIGLSQYAQVFRTHDIDARLLAGLSAEDLREIGVASLGHRKRILEAIAALGAAARPAVPRPAVAVGAPAAPARPAYTPRHLSERILQSRSAMEGERKQVSVLFADVQGSMELAGQLDPEQWHAVLEGFFAILTEGVHRFEGTVNQYTGDGIMALFGAPLALEDHAQRACFAALHMQGEIERYAIEVKRAHGVGFSTRMGINSGEVVVGRIGDDLRMDYTAQGHTVGLAQRMESLAEPNGCYVAASTAALVQGYFELRDLGDFQVKGVAGPVRVHRLIGQGEAHSRFDLSRRRGLSRFVGRQADLALLRQALAEAMAGRGQVVDVVAEAGTGKSRLCFELLEQCRARGLAVFEGRAVAHGRDIPLLPILELLRGLLGVGPREDARQVREKVAGRVVLLDPALGVQLPLLFDFLGVADARALQPPVDPQTRQRALLAMLQRLLRHACAQAPVVLMLEDLHWLDEASRECVAQLVEACSGMACLLLCNHRPEERPSWHGRNGVRVLPLRPLDGADIAELVHGLLGPDPSIAELAGAIHDRTGGNPFFAEEIVRALRESGQLAGAPGACRLVVPVAHLEVPATVQAVLAARIDRLGETEKQLLQHAAVIGKEFAQPLLERVAALDAAALAAALGVLQHGGFVQALALYPQALWAFSHPLTQEVALQGQLREHRRAAHAAVARAIEALDAHRLEERAALLAHHWEAAGDALAAARWHQRAAESPACPDFGWAVHHWERVRELLRGCGNAPELIQQRMQACTRLLTLGQRLGASPESSRVLLDEGLALADACGDARARIRLQMAHGWAEMRSGDTGACLALMEAIAPQLQALQDPALWAVALGNNVLLNSFAARFDVALALIAQGQEALSGDSAPAGHGLGSLNATATLGQFRAYCLAWTGHPAEALDAYAATLRLADPVGELAVFARCHIAELHYLLGQAPAALVRAREAESVCEALGAPGMLRARVQVAYALGHLAAGEAAPAMHAAREALAIHRDMDRVHAGLSAWLLAEAHLLAGDPAAAHAAAVEAVALCRFSLRANYEICALGVQARAALRLQGTAARDEAAAALQAAQHLLQRTGSQVITPWLARWCQECGIGPSEAAP